MKANHCKIVFEFSRFLVLAGKATKITDKELYWANSLITKALSSALVTLEYDFMNEATVTLIVDVNKLEYPIETLKELVELINARIDGALDTIENRAEHCSHSELNDAKRLVKLSANLGETNNALKCDEYEMFRDEKEVTFRSVNKVILEYDSEMTPCLSRLSFRAHGQVINCSIDRDKLFDFEEALNSFASGDIYRVDIFAFASKNMLGKYNDVKIVGIEQSD